MMGKKVLKRFFAKQNGRAKKKTENGKNHKFESKLLKELQQFYMKTKFAKKQKRRKKKEMPKTWL